MSPTVHNGTIQEKDGWGLHHTVNHLDQQSIKELPGTESWLVI